MAQGLGFSLRALLTSRGNNWRKGFGLSLLLWGRRKPQAESRKHSEQARVCRSSCVKVVQGDHQGSAPVFGLWVCDGGRRALGERDQ